MTNTSEALESMDSMTRAQNPLEIDGVVTIAITSELETQDPYYAKTYPWLTGKAYKVPVYKVTLTSTARPDEVGLATALRFMPTQETQDGRVFMCGLYEQQSVNSPTYDPLYDPHNRPAQINGAFSIKGNHLLHAGPSSITDYGNGGRGCIQVIDFKTFKEKIIYMAGRIVPSDELDKMLVFLCNKNRIRIVIQGASMPELLPTDPIPEIEF